jgi:hypothetical protein
MSAGERPYTQEMVMIHRVFRREDTLLWPKLLIRADMDGPLIDRMRTQHEQAAARLESAQQLGEWRNTAEPDTCDRLADELADLTAELDQHLTDEETHVLPLVAEHITVEEWAALGEHGLASLGKKKLLMTLGAVLEDATAAERAHFLAKVPLAGRMAWHLIGRRKYRRMIRRRRTS